MDTKTVGLGFVRLVDVMGDDSSVVQAARVSYGKGTKSVNDDRNLIRYLMRHRHTTPFEMVEFKFHLKMPIFIARQWMRHRTASINEISGRYSELDQGYYDPPVDDFTVQSSQNKQGGSEDLIENPDTCSKLLRATNYSSRHAYQTLLKKNLRRELARTVLPLATYTEFYWKIDLHNLMHFLKLRLDSHAQLETRLLAQAVASYVAEVCPISYQAFTDYVLGAVTFSANELAALSISFDNVKAKGNLSKREVKELEEKLNKIKGKHNEKTTSHTTDSGQCSCSNHTGQN